jgi:peptide/nickel transport system permease protein
MPLFILSVFIVVGITAPWIAPHDPLRGNLRERNQPPVWAEGGTSKYLLGTDHLGRDVLSRVIHGARISLIVASTVILVGITVGVFSGLLAGWYGGWVDEFFMRLVDIKLAIPTILVALVLVLALGQSFILIIAVLAITIWPRIARNVRGEVLRLKTMDYVALAKVAGASTPRILAIHLFPGVINTLIVLTTLEIGIVILLEATLSFLGAGVPPPTPAWGSMVAEGRDRLAVAWWISTIPGLAIMIVVMASNLFGDWLRDTLDPRLRQLQ